MSEYLQSVINAFQDLIFIFDRDGNIVEYLTPNHKEKLFLDPEDFLKRHYTNVLPDHVCDELEEAFEKVEKGAESVKFDYSLKFKNEKKWYEAVISQIKHKNSRQYLGVIRNITHRVRAEKALEESEQKYKRMFDNIRDVFFQTDSNGIIRDVSPSIERYSGYSRQDLIGKPVRHFYLYSEDYDKLIEKLSEDGEVIDYEVRLKTKFNQIAYASINAHQNLDNFGSVLGIEGYMRDISDRKKAEQELSRTNEELKKLNSQKDKLFSVIAHDLRNSITGSTGILEVVFDNFDSISKDKMFEYLKPLQHSLSSTSILLEDLLMWSRNQFEHVSIDPEEVNLSETVDKVIGLIRIPAKEKKITIQNKVPGNLDVTADPNMLNTILRNLLSNAVKFSNEHGNVTLIAEESDTDIKIAVEDNGVGISEEALNKIFDKHNHYTSRGTNDEKGSGLGLDLCIDFVEKHGGSITADSEPGQGSTFTFTLPR